MKKAYSREFSRSGARVRARIALAGKEGTFEGQTRDLSMNGLCVKCGCPLPVGAECDISLVLEGGGQDILVNMKGIVARVDKDVTALSFTQIEDDSLEHLRRLILYNSEETEKAEHEFDEHLGIRARSGPGQF